MYLCCPLHVQLKGHLILAHTLGSVVEPISAQGNVSAPVLERSVLAECSWKTLAPLMAASPTMFLWSPGTRFDTSQDLTKALPDKPAAVPLYRRGRTRLLALDFDSKHLGSAAVDADRERVLALLGECGLRAVVDVSVSGGAHVLVPLRIAVLREEIRPVLDALAAMCPTLDLSPMLNKSWTGCITVPGSRCREGGFRQLVGSLGAAGEVLRLRNGSQGLEMLAAALGVRLGTRSARGTDLDVPAAVFVGGGPGARLAAEFRFGGEIPAVVAAFATDGVLAADGRWQSPSEARQSVLVHAMGRGLNLDDVRSLIAVGQDWAGGLGAAYARYRHAQDKALRADWSSAARWHVQRVASFHGDTHKTTHTGVAVSSAVHAAWLRNALWWCDTTLRSSPWRWQVAAVLQALAFLAARGGRVVKGVPVVAAGGRSLAVGAGLLGESTVWAVLRLLREMPGAPILLSEKGCGLGADEYALTTPDVLAPDGVVLPELVDVHVAWWVIGWGHRRVYETVLAGGVVRAADVAAAARMSLAATYESLGELCRCGLLERQRGRWRAGEVSLDQVADENRVWEERRLRLAEHRIVRQQWRDWLGGRWVCPVVEAVVQELEPVVAFSTLTDSENRDCLDALMANGPPVYADDSCVTPRQVRRGGGRRPRP